MLTDKTKQDFEKWYDKHCVLSHDKAYYTDLDYFSFSAKYGAYVDFFDSVGIYVFDADAIWNEDDSEYCLQKVILGEKFNTETTLDFSGTRNEARRKAIEQANKIYNER